MGLRFMWSISPSHNTLSVIHPPHHNTVCHVTFSSVLWETGCQDLALQENVCWLVWKHGVKYSKMVLELLLD